jgi:hypothetical protein
MTVTAGVQGKFQHKQFYPDKKEPARTGWLPTSDFMLIAAV